jgi:hypothetical protein
MNYYRIFASEADDWYVASKLDEEGEITILYEGHDRDKALESIMDAEGCSFREIYKNMDGSYEPTMEDFK